MPFNYNNIQPPPIRLFNAPKLKDVVAKHKAGVCASFAFDWLKKKLALKIINESTYDTSGMLKSRLRKIVSRQKKYESKDGDLNVLAESYGLQLIAPAYTHTRMKGRTPIAFKPAQGGCYYISLKDQHDNGHAIGFHLPSSTFCDANYGIFDLNGGSIGSVIQLYWDEGMGARGNLAYVYPVQLKTDPKIVPAD